MLAYSWHETEDDDFLPEAPASHVEETTSKAQAWRPANDNIEAGISSVRPEDVDDVKANFWVKLAAVRPSIGRLGRARELVRNAVLLFEMLVDPSFKIPWRTAAGIVFALAYFISSLDVIPDAIPVLGFFDDALVVAEVVYMFSADIRRFEESRRARAGRKVRAAA